MASPEWPRDTVDAQIFSDSKFGPEAAARLRVAFERSRHPMLIADDQRRWVTGNAAACDLLGITRDEVPWHTSRVSQLHTKALISLRAAIRVARDGEKLQLGHS